MYQRFPTVLMMDCTYQSRVYSLFETIRIRSETYFDHHSYYWRYLCSDGSVRNVTERQFHKFKENQTVTLYPYIVMLNGHPLTMSQLPLCPTPHHN